MADLSTNYIPSSDDSKSYNEAKNETKDRELAAKLIGDWQHLYGLRGNWNSHWTEIAQRIYPMDSWLFQNFSQLNSQGDKRNFEVYDSTGINALQKFGAILDSLLTPRDQFWHILEAEDPILMRDKGVRLWFEQVNTILFKQRYASNANFESQNQKQYLSLGAYGTGSMFIDDLAGFKGLRYKNVHLGEIYLQENHQGIVDSVCRHFMLTARQAFQKFGEKCPDTIKGVYKSAPERPFYFLHWVRPREDMDPERRDFKGMPIASYYVSVEGSTVVQEEGYKSFPYAISRYFQASNEVYGRSPAMDVLPSIKTLNEQKKAMLKQGHRATDPVLLAHDDGVIDGFDLTPGSLNMGGVSSDGRALVHTLPVGNVQAGKEMMEEEKALINDTFLVSLFQILTENPEMTATEVLERTREKGMLLSPTVGRQESEYKGPMIHRELDILSKQGLLPPQPKLLKSAKGAYKIVHDSPISRAQKAEWASGAMRTVEQLMTVSQAMQDPSYLDYINWNVAAPAVAKINGTPDSWINTKEDIQKMRQSRAKQQQVQTAIQAAPSMAAVVKAKAQTQGSNQG